MRNISEYINEARTQSSPVEYTPKNREELIDAICEVATVQKRKKVIDFNCIDTSNVTDMSRIFPAARDRVKILGKRDFLCDKWDVSNVTNFTGMFQGMIGFTGKGLDEWSVSRNCKRVEHMLEGTGTEYVDLTEWDLSGVSSIDCMFHSCPELTVVGFPRNMRSLQSMRHTFVRSQALEQVQLPEVTSEIKNANACFLSAGVDGFRINNIDTLRCVPGTCDFEQMFAYSQPARVDLFGFINANKLGIEDCKQLWVDDEVIEILLRDGRE